VPSVHCGTNAMKPSSRTPEGLPSRCPLCGAETNLEFSHPAGDAPCPECGHLLWLSVELLSWFLTHLADRSEVKSDSVNAGTEFAQLGIPLLDTVGLVMELEDKSDLSTPDNVVDRFETVGDVVRYIEQSQRLRGIDENRAARRSPTIEGPVLEPKSDRSNYHGED
jgi:acyl carrier protein